MATVTLERVENKEMQPGRALALCQVSDVPAQGGLRRELTDHIVVSVFRAGGEYFVVDDKCTHGSASLAEGEVVGEDIECPFHFGTFSLRSGEPTGRPCSIPLRTYPATVRDGVIYITDPTE
jgi:nitrite reductase/ring-hydroxylating ferredoxin subunit